MNMSQQPRRRFQQEKPPTKTKSGSRFRDPDC